MLFLVGRAAKPQLLSSLRSSHAHFCTRQCSAELIFRGRGLSARSRFRRGRPSCALLACRGGHLSRLGRPLATAAPSPLARPAPSVRVAAGGNQGLDEQPPATPFTERQGYSLPEQRDHPRETSDSPGDSPARRGKSLRGISARGRETTEDEGN